MTPDDYTDFRCFFDKVVRDYHGDASLTRKHLTSWEIDRKLDVKQFGLDDISMRVRVGRNLVGTTLPGLMSKEERIDFEQKLLPAFDSLIEKYGGRVVSLSPEFGPNKVNPNFISEGQYLRLVKDHIMFKNMSADSFLMSAGLSSDWPFGRGCWYSEDMSKIIWFGEEDHLRIICIESGTDLLLAFRAVKELHSYLESIDGIDFAQDDNYGYVTSCPSNLGTGMRASALIKVPLLTTDGTSDKVKVICNKLGLSVRGIGGEHTPIGKDGTIDVSPSSRLFVTEAQIITALYTGMESLISIERTVSKFINDGANPGENSSVVTTEQQIEYATKETRDDDESSINFILINNDVDRQQTEDVEQYTVVKTLKKEARKKASMNKKETIKLLSPETKSKLAMSDQSPSSLSMSPSPVLAIKNE